MKYYYPAFILFVAFTTCSTAGMSQSIKEIDLVKLSGFTSQLVNHKVSLNWSTQQEQVVNYYGVERSYDNKEFRQVAIVFPHEAEAATNNNSYNDPIKNTTASVIYYRLKLVDRNGTYKYSEASAVHKQ
jgi:hypothetical protein